MKRSFSRRAILGLGLTAAAGAAGIGLWLRSRTAPQSALLSALQSEPSPSDDPLPASGGELAAFDAQSVTLLGPMGTRTFPLMQSATFVDGSLEPAELSDIDIGRNMILFGSSLGFQRVELVQPFGDLPAGLILPAQTTPTGEQIAIGSQAMIVRAGWGAAPPDHTVANESGFFDPGDPASQPEGWWDYPPPLRDWLTTLVVHHSALQYRDGPREIQAFHMLDRGWADIAYHYLIDGFGQLYEGRTLGARGAHTEGANTGTVGVCLLGNFDRVLPTRAQMNALTSLAGYLRDTYAITHVAGHRDFNPDITECPGETLEPMLAEFAQSVGLTLGTGGYRPPPGA